MPQTQVEQWKVDALFVMWDRLKSDQSRLSYVTAALGMSLTTVKRVLRQRSNRSRSAVERQALARKVHDETPRLGMVTLAWLFKDPPSHPTMSELIGMAEAKDDVRYYFTKDSGVGNFCLTGPPGTGKSVLAMAIALEKGYQVLLANLLDLASTQKIEKLFDFARNHSQPLVLVFDDVLDAAGVGDGKNEILRSNLVIELNKPRRDDLKVVAASNHFEKWDEALASRFEEVYIDKPSAEERVQLLKLFLRDFKRLRNVDWESTKGPTDGLSSRDLEHVALEVGKLCWRENRRPTRVIRSSMSLRTELVINAIRKVVARKSRNGRNVVAQTN